MGISNLADTGNFMSGSEDSLMKQRFRGYLPVVIDVETAGFNASTDALLEIAAVILNFDEHVQLLFLLMNLSNLLVFGNFRLLSN